MALRSQILRDDPALQACLLRDEAHVLPGSCGSHVTKIQAALLLDKRLSIPVNELRAHHYGPTTAATVLEFKRERNIINLAYQAARDDIVGKMTIARLDVELFTLEQHPDPGRVVCRASSGLAFTNSQQAPAFLRVGGTSRRRVPPPITFRKSRIVVVFQETDAAVAAGGGVQLLLAHFLKARELMAPFGLDFAGAAENGIFPLMGPRIPDSEQVITGSPASTFSVRAAAERVLPGQGVVLRVIYCPFSIKDEVNFGITTADSWEIGTSRSSAWSMSAKQIRIKARCCTKSFMQPGARNGTMTPIQPASFPKMWAAWTKLPPEHAEALAHAFFSFIFP
jgi:hypothetical protein